MSDGLFGLTDTLCHQYVRFAKAIRVGNEADNFKTKQLIELKRMLLQVRYQG